MVILLVRAELRIGFPVSDRQEEIENQCACPEDGLESDSVSEFSLSSRLFSSKKKTREEKEEELEELTATSVAVTRKAWATQSALGSPVGSHVEKL